MSPDRDRAVGLTGARFGRVADDAEPDEPTEPEHTEPDREAPGAAPEPSDQAAGPDAAWDDDVDDPPRPTGARFARQPGKRGRSAKAARRPAETGRAESSRAPSGPAAVPSAPEPAGTVAPAAAHQATWPAYRPPTRPETEPDEPAIDEPDGPDTAVRVRPYIHTGGRTRSRLPLPIESLVTTSPGGSLHHLHGAHRSVAELCRTTTQSVAEVSAKLGVPLGVARVLVDDLVAARAVTVYGETVGDNPDLALMERVLAGLRRL